MLPAPYRVASVEDELVGTRTLELVSVNGEQAQPAPGQFSMLYAFGVGEVPISVSGFSDGGGQLYTIRGVGAVTRALCETPRGATVGVRGPFGSSWPLDGAEGHDLVIVAGGLGLAPLRPAVRRILAERQRFQRLTILYGARSPADILFVDDLERWRGRMDANVEVTVDLSSGDWRGDVGVVTSLIGTGRFDPEATTALVCGPEIMMRFSALELQRHGVPAERIFVSLERNMHCAIALCGHCQLGPEFVCRDGPIVPYARVGGLLGVREV